MNNEEKSKKIIDAFKNKTIDNRKVNTLTEEEKQIIKNIKIDYEKYSDEKKKRIIELQNLILNYN